MMKLFFNWIFIFLVLMIGGSLYAQNDPLEPLIAPATSLSQEWMSILEKIMMILIGFGILFSIYSFTTSDVKAGLKYLLIVLCFGAILSVMMFVQ